jgi:streptomycin 6-kinase
MNTLENKKLNNYLTAWNLSNPQVLTQTMTSHIYTVIYETETVILKLLSPSEIDEQRGAVALRCFDGHGAVRLLRYDQGAQLMEYAAGDELVILVERGDDEHATRIIAQVIQQLHGVPQNIPHDGLTMLEHWFEALFNKATSDRQMNINSIYVRSASLAEQLLVGQREVRVLHGDIHHRNIRQTSRGWLTFDPKGLIGERTYDCANTLCNPEIPELVHNEARLLTTAAILADTLALDLSRVLAFTYAYACLNASWWLPRLDTTVAEDIVHWHLKIATLVEPHVKQL